MTQHRTYGATLGDIIGHTEAERLFTERDEIERLLADRAIRKYRTRAGYT